MIADEDLVAVPPDLVGLAVEDKGKQVPTDGSAVDVDRVAIQPAGPTLLGALEFQPVNLALDRDFVKHRLSERLRARRLLPRRSLRARLRAVGSGAIPSGRVAVRSI